MLGVTPVPLPRATTENWDTEVYDGSYLRSEECPGKFGEVAYTCGISSGKSGYVATISGKIRPICQATQEFGSSTRFATWSDSSDTAAVMRGMLSLFSRFSMFLDVRRSDGRPRFLEQLSHNGEDHLLLRA